jgi:hypothetical protein
MTALVRTGELLFEQSRQDSRSLDPYRLQLFRIEAESLKDCGTETFIKEI